MHAPPLLASLLLNEIVGTMELSSCFALKTFWKEVSSEPTNGSSSFSTSTFSYLNTSWDNSISTSWTNSSCFSLEFDIIITCSGIGFGVVHQINCDATFNYSYNFLLCFCYFKTFISSIVGSHKVKGFMYNVPISTTFYSFSFYRLSSCTFGLSCKLFFSNLYFQLVQNTFIHGI